MAITVFNAKFILDMFYVNGFDNGKLIQGIFIVKTNFDWVNDSTQKE
jgi:hypothetical protein